MTNRPGSFGKNFSLALGAAQNLRIGSRPADVRGTKDCLETRALILFLPGGVSASRNFGIGLAL